MKTKLKALENAKDPPNGLHSLSHGVNNRTSTQAGGDAGGAGLRLASYSANSLNQYTSRGVPGAFDVLGLANQDATVTVNSLATYRRGEYFWKEATAANGAGPVYPTVTVSAQWGTTNQTTTGNQFVAQTPETFLYDPDGSPREIVDRNRGSVRVKGTRRPSRECDCSGPVSHGEILLRDGRWDYTWDAETRLAKMTTRSDVTVAPVRRVEFQYDWEGRRIGKKVYDARTGGTLLSESRYLYDRWNLLAELNGSNQKVRGWVWGADLSGSLQGAGGVGGLLKVSYTGAATTNCFVGYDGNGNVTLLADAATGAVLAQYEYGPFGEVIRQTGPMAKYNPSRFSTKYQDDETDLLYYGYRYYHPSGGRWLNRDPIEDLNPLLENALLQQTGDLTFDAEVPDDFDPVSIPLSSSGSLYSFVRNNAISLLDPFGLADTGGKGKPRKITVKNVTITHYCNCKKCTGKNPGDKGYGITADGSTACEGTVAADWKKFPKGAKLTWTDPDGNTVTGTVHDKGGAIKGNHLDNWCKTHDEALKKGKYKTTVTVELP